MGCSASQLLNAASSTACTRGRNRSTPRRVAQCHMLRHRVLPRLEPPFFWTIHWMPCRQATIVLKSNAGLVPADGFDARAAA